MQIATKYDCEVLISILLTIYNKLTSTPFIVEPLHVLPKLGVFGFLPSRKKVTMGHHYIEKLQCQVKLLAFWIGALNMNNNSQILDFLHVGLWALWVSRLKLKGYLIWWRLSQVWSISTLGSNFWISLPCSWKLGQMTPIRMHGWFKGQIDGRIHWLQRHFCF